MRNRRTELGSSAVLFSQKIGTDYRCKTGGCVQGQNLDCTNFACPNTCDVPGALRTTTTTCSKRRQFVSARLDRLVQPTENDRVGRPTTNANGKLLNPDDLGRTLARQSPVRPNFRPRRGEQGCTAPSATSFLPHARRLPHAAPKPSVSPRNLEREKGFEPSTSTLARWHSTTELLPRNEPGF